MIDWQETVRYHILHVIDEHPAREKDIDLEQLLHRLNKKQHDKNQRHITPETLVEQIRIMVFEGYIGMRLDLDGFGEKVEIYRFFLPPRFMAKPTLIAQSYPALAELQRAIKHTPELLAR